MDAIINAMVEAMEQSIQDDPEGEGYWRMGQNGGAFRVTTRFTRNPNLSNNGGDYDFYMVFWEEQDGIHAMEDTSCNLDFDWGFREVTYPTAQTLDELVKRARARLLSK